MEKILLVGGAGFIGRHLSGKLASKNKYIVHVIDNLSRKDNFNIDLKNKKKNLIL